MLPFEINFFDIFSKFKFHRNIYIAYSGGVDSSVLLYLCCSFFNRKKFFIKAIHVNHGYSKASLRWKFFCKNICNEYKIPLVIFDYINFNQNKNIEQEFRFIRFNIFFNFIAKNSTLLLAHNEDDFLETMFLRLFRGSSVFSVFGIQYTAKLGKLNILRPLINFNKSDITNFAHTKKIKYIIDFSNFDVKFSRNYIRCKILPLIIFKWPNFNKVVLKSFILSSNFYFYFYFRLLFFSRSSGFDLNFLNLTYLYLLPYFLRCEVIKFWIKSNNFTTPSYYQFKELDKILYSIDKKTGYIFLKEYILRRYNSYLFIEKILYKNKFYFISVYYRFIDKYYLSTFILVRYLNIYFKFFLLENFFLVRCSDYHFFVLGLFYSNNLFKSCLLFKSLY